MDKKQSPDLEKFRYSIKNLMDYESNGDESRNSVDGLPDINKSNTLQDKNLFYNDPEPIPSRNEKR